MILAQKTIIVNMGDGDLGKSESILMVYEELCELAKIEKDNVKQKETSYKVMAEKYYMGTR